MLRTAASIALVLSAAFCSVLALFLPAPLSVYLNAGAAVCASAAAVLGLSSFRSVAKLIRSLERISREAGAGEGKRIDLARLVDGSSLHGELESLEGLDALLAYVNDDVSSLQRSSVKFDLFASDILFSADQLASQSERQLEMLVGLRGRADAYFDGVSRTNAELVSLSESIRENARIAGELRERALASRERLAALTARIRSAAEEASRGGADVAQTMAAAARFEQGLRSLTTAAEREAAEARRIGESLRAVEDIVERTHVLATNASIEAARAGTRGAGFAVIAQEIRKLADSSRTALADVSVVLGSVARGIDDSADLVSRVSTAAGELGAAVAKSRTTFEAIGSHVTEIDRSVGEFNGVFSDQIDTAARASSSSTGAAERLGGFEDSFRDRSADYERIVRSVEESEGGAVESRRSARFLAQLAGYLKAGGGERNRILKRYVVDGESGARKFGRKARRETLLYNLEVMDAGGRTVGRLGDLSATGLLLLSSRELPLDARMEVQVVMPLSIEGERVLPLRVRTRRSESDSEGFRVGCSFEDASPEHRSRVEELLRTLAISSSDLLSAAPAEPRRTAAAADDAEELSELEAL